MNEADTIKQYAIYDHPIDYPDSYVVREWLVSAGEVTPGPAQAVDTLDEAHALIPAGATRLPDTGADDPKIIEVWM